MANLSLRRLSVFLFAAFLLNITNYLFIRVYNTPHSNLDYSYPKTASGLEISRAPITPEFWSADVQSSSKAKTVISTHHRKNHSETNSTFSSHYSIQDQTKTTVNEIDYCPELPPGLGPDQGNRALTVRSAYNNYETKVNEAKLGGIYQPTNCKSQHTVAILVAYRGCRSNIVKFMNILHPFLIKQQLDYQIFVVEQSNSSQPYNRGKLLNVGFMEAMRLRKSTWRCIIIHEPNIVPLDSRNLYRCSWYPKQLATKILRPVKAPYRPLLGGAIAMTPYQFLKVNGFSNAYWGNDADYLDLYHRINSTNYLIENSIPRIGIYRMLMKGVGLWRKSEYFATPSPLYLLDGLTSLTYTVDVSEMRPLYTYLKVNIDAVVQTKSKAKIYDRLLNPVTYKTKQQLK